MLVCIMRYHLRIRALAGFKTLMQNAPDHFRMIFGKLTPSLFMYKSQYVCFCKYLCRILSYFLLLVIVCPLQITAQGKTGKPVLRYTVSMPEPATHYYHVALLCDGWPTDTVVFKMPKWTTGYYQLMDYAKAVENMSAAFYDGKKLSITQVNENTWQLVTKKNKPFNLAYRVKADRQFVANPFLDSTHAYIVGSGLFVYVEGFVNTPVSLQVTLPSQWRKIATGLEPVTGKPNTYLAPDFDVLYDSPLLIGNLEELPSFRVRGIEHRFIGYKLGDFDKAKFMTNLKKVVEAAIDVMDDIPYKQYTFIATGPGMGGIEHLNNTTVSFEGNELASEAGMSTMMKFLAHEYFHHYNVKRIRPLELGPFDYDKENRTNLLWLSEGLTVYYEYMIVKRAGLINEQTLFKNFEGSINAYENDPGRFHQSLAEASYQTWSDGPFGNQNKDGDKSISYYEKGPVVGLLLDFSIRYATSNKKSLDDVMRYLYGHYYKQLHRGLTDAELQQACESVAGILLTPIFEYTYTIKELDYTTYLGFAGLQLEVGVDQQTSKRKFVMHKLDKMTPDQLDVFQAWLGN